MSRKWARLVCLGWTLTSMNSNSEHLTSRGDPWFLTKALFSGGAKYTSVASSCQAPQGNLRLEILGLGTSDILAGWFQFWDAVLCTTGVPRAPCTHPAGAMLASPRL